MCGLCTGAYGLLDATAPAFLGLPAMACGAALCVAGLSLGGRRITRTTYRPDPWLLPEWAVAGSGVLSAILLFSDLGYDPAQLNPTFYPLTWPGLPVVPAAAILLAGTAGFLAPEPAAPVRRTDTP
ncbi:energy-coupling factor transporter transmembrane protein EcfT, partial [Streptomyces sp. SID625]|nr:energy-coupling factor transporter transmembrane protein EcfT [Streptomyces sp. SID625]